MIRRTADQFKVTSVVISHDMASTFRIGDRISMLHEGKIVASGTPEEVLRSSHPVLREFVETSGAVAMIAAHAQPASASSASSTSTLPRPTR
jgi:phospholipid/cholesterol/gamma-HCH transport system ATP-binding protein